MLYFSPSAKSWNEDRAAESGGPLDDDVLLVLADEDIRDLAVQSARQERAESLSKPQSSAASGEGR